ncbi:MAG: low-specificity L-threonine aldolase [Pirellulaceae bacterium]|nr:low-specificity L-threonine aldolase [Pirellulaceae bacterium]
MIDLRSDTVTQPCAAMRQAMANAEVGDDVIDVDPTTARLQAKIAEMLGKEAAMFMPSGTMTNQAAVRLHCQPGDEMICEEGCHIYNYEQGGFAQLSLVIPRTIRGTRSQFQVEDVADLIRPDNEHAVRTRLLSLENTHNRGGGVILPLENVQALCRWARDNGLATHLDGARLFNAVVATGVAAEEWAKEFDTVSVCFSKGLGAPVGSALAGPRDMLERLRRIRKLFGGAMRQSGIIAAAALYALEHNVERLAKDHEAAQIIAQALQNQCPQFELDPRKVDTNIVIFKVNLSNVSAAKFCEVAKKAGVWLLPFSRVHVRAVTHLHISQDDAFRAAATLTQLHEQLASGKIG